MQSSAEEFSEAEWGPNSRSDKSDAAFAESATATALRAVKELMAEDQSLHDGVVSKTVSGVVSKVRGNSHILTPAHIQQLEEALPTTYQCYDWDLIYR
jgi:hypothetical protein